MALLYRKDPTKYQNMRSAPETRSLHSCGPVRIIFPSNRYGNRVGLRHAVTLAAGMVRDKKPLPKIMHGLTQ